MKHYYVYILSNDAHTLYVGMTDDLPKRFQQHKERVDPEAFTARYTFDRLVYFEVLDSVDAAAAREKQLKGWTRRKKVALIQEKNPRWHDLSTTWVDALRLK